MPKSKELSQKERQELIAILKERFEKHMSRHKGIQWSKIQAKLEDNPDKLWSINEMERTGGEPDVISLDKNQITFIDCSPETPKGRTNVCYDKVGQKSRKDVQPKGGNAMDMAAAMGIEILSEEQYRKLQTFGEFDKKTSTWLQTPSEIRKLGGAIFGDFRYGKVFVYHNGAQSFYSSRGFRGMVRINLELENS